MEERDREGEKGLLRGWDDEMSVWEREFVRHVRKGERQAGRKSTRTQRDGIREQEFRRFTQRRRKSKGIWTRELEGGLIRPKEWLQGSQQEQKVRLNKWLDFNIKYSWPFCRDFYSIYLSFPSPRPPKPSPPPLAFRSPLQLEWVCVFASAHARVYILHFFIRL